jgi:hypothetical protein
MQTTGTIRRHADGSLNTNYYLDRGRVMRSRATIHATGRFLDLVILIHRQTRISIKRIAENAARQMPFPRSPVSHV